ncbi:hypothetical protein FO519_006720 [Halicephalobus sp. NKZ332]|nr:hypothetical protein FO519_006720 [Halicephalobus sp. NKZ332]
MTLYGNSNSPCVSVVPWASLLATGVALGGCILFCASFADGVDGFLFQINTMISVTTSEVNDAVKSTLIKIGIIFGASTLIFFVVSVFATSALATTPSRSVDDFDSDSKPLYFRILSSRRTVGVSILFAHFILILWLFVLCGCAMAMILYAVYFSTMSSFCSLLNDQCFDFKVLYPIIQRLTSNWYQCIRYIGNSVLNIDVTTSFMKGGVLIHYKVDLVLCKEKKEALCSSNYLGDFIVAFFCCIIALVGIVHFLMCMSANYARLSPRQAVKKGKHYAMNTGTVDSDSIIVQNMGK